MVALAGSTSSATADELQSWSKVEKPPDTSFSPDHYTGKQLYCNVPYYLKHFPALANAVIEKGEDRGFIDLHVWRTPFARHNLRIMENHAAFAYFYTKKASWNPYYGDPEVRKRLEAVLTYLNKNVGPNGEVSEYSPEKSNPAALSFGANKLMLTLELLHKKGPDIDQEVFEATRKTARRMIMRLTKPNVFNRGSSNANQVESLWFSASLYHRLSNDEEVKAAMLERFKKDFDMMQSPAGFFYESGTTEWGYNLGTHKGILNYVSTEIGPFPELEEAVRNRERRFWRWVADSVVPVQEPKDGFLLNGGLQSRGLGRTSFKDRDYIHAASFLPSARAFSQSLEEAKHIVEKRRSALAAKGRSSIDPLNPGNGGAYRFPIYRLGLSFSFPSEAQIKAAQADLPYNSQEKFIRQRVDAGQHFNPPFAATFVRQPAYYMAFNSGGLKSMQRVGLGLLWNPVLGPLVQNTNPNTKKSRKLQSERPSWGIAREAFTEPINGHNLNASFRTNGQELNLKSGVHDYEGGDLQVSYPLGKKGKATWYFEPSRIRGKIRLPGDFVHQIPIIPDRNSIELSSGSAVYTKGNATLRISWRPASKPQWKPADETKTAPKINFLAIPATDALNVIYDFRK